MSADLVLKMTTILKEMRIAQLCSKSERTLVILKQSNCHKKGANIFNADFGENILSSGGCFPKKPQYFDKLPFFKS